MNTMLPHKLGANRNEMAQKPRKHDQNFSQSRDVREDRGARREKFTRPPQSTRTQSASSNAMRKRHLHSVPPASPESGKHPVVMRLSHPTASRVSVAGTFNQWHPETTPLVRLDNEKWVVVLLLEPGLYEYRFLIDGQWTDDPSAQQYVPNGLGGQNCVLKVS